MSPDRPESFPPYAFVPGGPWPHPKHAPQPEGPPAEPAGDASALIQRGAALFNAGYYWEAHEVWETLWHAFGRRGASADLLKGLIKLAAAGVKVRERQPRGVVTHARRAIALFESVKAEAGAQALGLELDALIGFAGRIAADPPHDPEPPGARASRVFDFEIK